MPSEPRAASRGKTMFVRSSRARRIASATLELSRRRTRTSTSASSAADAPLQPPPNQRREKSVLFLSTVWPEPHSSAAGVRTVALLRAFARAGYSRISVGASAARNDASAALERSSSSPVSVFSVPLNRTEALDEALDRSRPDVVVFDRFTSEEAFSFRVRERFPDAARVLDMQDCHSLRRARARAVEEADKSGENAVLAAARVVGWDAADRDAVREASSILRSDLTLVCSPFELDMLNRTLFRGGEGGSEKLVLAPLFASRPALGQTRQREFSSRKHFVAIGSFLHAPNVDSLLWLAGKRHSSKRKRDGPPSVWDLIRSSPGTKDAELHVYGSYPSRSGVAEEVHDPARGVFVRGRASNLSPLSRARVLLAPIRFGAGLKGKIADAWARGTPVVSTPIGAEGMFATIDGAPHGSGPWGGSRTPTTAEEFASEACRLYTDEEAWLGASREGSRLHDALYFDSRPADGVVAAVDALLEPSPSSSGTTLRQRRSKDFAGACLWADTSRATEYFSRWIELKEKSKKM